MPEEAGSSVVNPAGNTPLGQLALLFLRLGFAAFGGPAAHVSMIKSEIVLLAVVAAILIFRWRVNSGWLVGAGAVVGLVVQGLR